ncbi:hypothetical protein BN7_3222 [Wickerhamomyces ciferrii]|uniref:Protein transport protein SEC24 n=1 Tax=Wickerhamomyces ciferrii (strain ATCC 14091 / BCRC 22168 / CBS 111 / JCM 3599 / NBRC 0793 / NRRL Y-1031 F-60-10) TaxID=1206466 RepID=K0KQP8_WICCF|nr:uncharacterized protein BN7_3222 [Wickerhamomyces ciferrii]CCH43669.1 hypothetical protein BN7_3222 [Wickerhamomyces ciferrii]
MSGHRRRHYPQAQYQVNQPAANIPPAGQAGVVPGYPGQAPYAANPNPALNGVNGVPGAQGATPAYYTPGAAAPVAGGINGYPQQGQDPSIDAATQGFSNMNIQGIPTLPQQPTQGYPQQSVYPGAPVAPVAPVAGGYNGITSPQDAANALRQTLPLNQLYQTDLLKELPPPIQDLSLPPPPLVIPSDATLIPNNPNANTPPEFTRSTLNAIPTTHSLLKKSKLPLALVIRPYISLKNETKPVATVGDAVISRCRRCRSYINPFVQLTNNNTRWRCNLCSLVNDIPAAFDHDAFQNVPANRYERSELNHSVVEFIAPKEYAVRSPEPLTYAFLIDVSIHSISSGLLATVATTILESLDRIPNEDTRARVAFIGIDSSLHFFNIPEDTEEGEPSILEVPDVDEPFTPSPDNLLVSLKDARQNIEKLLSNLPNLFANNANPSFALGPALQFAHKLIESSGGKVITFGSTLPNVGIGKLALRDEESVYDKPKEASTLLSVANSFYKSFAVDCNKSQITVEFFLTSSSYQDVATLANLPRFTAGQTHFYPGWSAASIEDVTKLSKEISNTLSSDIPLEAVFRARGSSGLRMSGFYGNFFNRSSDLCSYPTFPRDQNLVVEMSIEENITKPFVYIQSAILHSTHYGQRRIRVITTAIPTTSNISEVYASADQLAITSYYAHKAAEKVYSSSLIDARDLLNKYLIDLLNVFKKDVVASNTGGISPLMFSTNLRMLPLLIHSLTKNIAFRPGRVPSDHRANALNLIGSIPLPQLIRFIYPTVYSLHDIPDNVGLPDEETGEIVLPDAINAGAEHFERYGLYLINNTTDLFLWVGGDAVQGLVNDVFGIPDIFQVPIGKHELPVLENDFNERVRNIISKVRESHDTVMYQNLYIVRGGSTAEPINAANAREVSSLRLWAASNLVEDRHNNLPSYREFLSATKEKLSQ